MCGGGGDGCSASDRTASMARVNESTNIIAFMREIVVAIAVGSACKFYYTNINMINALRVLHLKH